MAGTQKKLRAVFFQRKSFFAARQRSLTAAEPMRIPNAQSARLDPGARLTIGKRLSERLYVTYARTLSSSTRDQIVLLEYDQTDRFSWVFSRNEDRTYALEVRVRHVF